MRRQIALVFTGLCLVTTTVRADIVSYVDVSDFTANSPPSVTADGTTADESLSSQYGSASASTTYAPGITTPVKVPPSFGAQASASATTAGFIGVGAEAKITFSDQLKVLFPASSLNDDPLAKEGLLNFVFETVYTFKLDGSLKGDFSFPGNQGSAVSVTAIATIPGVDPTPDANGDFVPTTYQNTQTLGYQDVANPGDLLPGYSLKSGDFSTNLAFVEGLKNIYASQISDWSVSVTLDAAAFADPGDSNVSASFSHTLTLESVGFYDANGNLIPGVQVTGSDGFNYPVLGSPSAAVPEPSSFVLLGFGAVACVIAASRRHIRSVYK